MNKNFVHKTKRRKVIPLNEHEPLLKSLGYEIMIGMFTSEEVNEAEILLKTYLENFPNIGNKKIILAYLFGVLQGMDEKFKGTSITDKNLQHWMQKACRIGLQTGISIAMLQCQQGEKK